MTLRFRSSDPRRDESFATVLDAAFARADRESALARALAERSDFEPDLALVAEEDGRAVAAAVLSPRALRFRGVEVACASVGPLGVVPEARGRGVGEALLVEGLDRLRRRGVRAAVAIGAPEFYARAGFAAAFDLPLVRVPVELAREHAGADDWRALRAEDLPRLPELHAASWRDVDGSEVRAADAQDWEARAASSYALCASDGAGLAAYVRFRVRETVEVTDCCVRDASAVARVLALVARLGAEHRRDVVELHLPARHPVARAAFRIGCPLEVSDFGGASMLALLDARGLLDDLAPTLLPALLGARRPALSLELEGESLLLAFRGGRFACTPGRDAEQHVAVPHGWGPGLVSGRTSGAELAFELGLRDTDLVRLLAELFPRRTPTWTYGPAFELADD